MDTYGHCSRAPSPSWPTSSTLRGVVAGTVAINVAGSFLLGLLTTVGAGLAPEVRTALGVGLLGGFTTFSTFSVDVLKQIEAGEGGKALLYVLASVILGIGAAAVGYYAGRAVA